MCLHTTHRQTGHCAVLCVGNHAVVLLNHRDDILDEYVLESIEAEATTRTSLARTTLWTLSLWTRTTKATLSRSWISWATNVETIIHEDYERHGFACGNQVIHDDARLTLSAPPRFILTHAMLQIEHWEFLRGILIILCGQIDVSVTHLLRHFRPVVNLIDRALRHVLHRIELLIGCGDINTASPTAGTIVVQTTWIGHRSTVNVQLIVVEALVLRF